MGAFYMNEAMFDLPELGFQDRTVTYLEGKTPSGGNSILAVERRGVPEGTTLRQVVASHVSDTQKRLRGCSVLSQRDVDIGDIPAVEVALRFRDETGAPVYTRQTHFILGSLWLNVAGEAPIGDREFCDGYVDHVLASLRLRE